jgi:hypothetical protein
MTTISLVTDVFVSKREALTLLSETLRLPIRDRDSADPWLALEKGISLHIEVPKFGEDLPLTLDVSGDNTSQLDEVCHTLTHTLTSALGWSLSRLGSGELLD